jgi:hypothetical protein
VTRVLGRLGPDYCVFRDVTIAGATIGHVLVGPGRICVINSDATRGKVTASEDVLYLNQVPTEGHAVHRTYSQAMALRRFLTDIPGIPAPFVQAVVVFTNARVNTPEPVGGVRVVSLRQLPAAVSCHRTRLGLEERLRIATALKRCETREPGMEACAGGAVAL